MAGTLVDFPEAVRCGQQEKNKPMVRHQSFLFILWFTDANTARYPYYSKVTLVFVIYTCIYDPCYVLPAVRISLV